MTTKLRGVTFKINWQYSADRKKTTCYVQVDRGDGNMVQVGSVTISLFYKDHFEYEKARKESLKRLLLSVMSQKDHREDRTEIWKTYFARIPEKVKA